MNWRYHIHISGHVEHQMMSLVFFLFRDSVSIYIAVLGERKRRGEEVERGGSGIKEYIVHIFK